LIDAMELLYVSCFFYFNTTLLTFHIFARSDLPIAMLARTLSFHPSTQTGSQTSDVPGKSAVIAVRIRETVPVSCPSPVSSPALSSLSLPCPGYRLTKADSISCDGPGCDQRVRAS
jgi:hypothetical protein